MRDRKAQNRDMSEGMSINKFETNVDELDKDRVDYDLTFMHPGSVVETKSDDVYEYDVMIPVTGCVWKKVKATSEGQAINKAREQVIIENFDFLYWAGLQEPYAHVDMHRVPYSDRAQAFRPDEL